jgi:hypothetical protein
VCLANEAAHALSSARRCLKTCKLQMKNNVLLAICITKPFIFGLFQPRVLVGFSETQSVSVQCLFESARAVGSA